MVLGEAAAPRHRRDVHARMVTLGEPHDVVPRAGAIDGRADHERGTPRGVERVAEARERVRLGPHGAADVAPWQPFGWLVPVVDRDRHEHRAARLLHRDAIRTRDRGRHVLRARRLDAPLHVRLRQLGSLRRPEERVERQDRARLLARGDDQRRAVLEGGEEIAHRVADARRGMQVDDRRIAGGLRVAVGHSDHDGFMQAEHVAEIVREVAEHRQLGRAGIAEHAVDAELAKQVDHRIANGDRCGGRVQMAGHARRSSMA
ncbi:hypothetical protein BLA6860_07458 [Burkholderia lata]|nr:hypothetical protein BLA6860_07458 [Burkholderia lata]